ncbi:MAG: rRNA maturation RNase YbeY [Verrucomicrobia bacterium]|nr:rRNA maturation RNase YbeY [Verrucomicrobiota bacterium]
MDATGSSLDASSRGPAIELRNAQRNIGVETRQLGLFAEIAAALAWRKRRQHSDICTVPMILISLVSDSRMAQLHRRFSGIPGATDVLTFQHGEIVISAETAARHGIAFATSTEHELRLYIVHGLLHLCGYDDTAPRARGAMQKVQSRILERALLFERTYLHGNFKHGSANARRGRTMPGRRVT